MKEALLLGNGSVIGGSLGVAEGVAGLAYSRAMTGLFQQASRSASSVGVLLQTRQYLSYPQAAAEKNGAGLTALEVRMPCIRPVSVAGGAEHNAKHQQTDQQGGCVSGRSAAEPAGERWCVRIIV